MEKDIATRRKEIEAGLLTIVNKTVARMNELKSTGEFVLTSNDLKSCSFEDPGAEPIWLFFVEFCQPASLTNPAAARSIPAIPWHNTIPPPVSPSDGFVDNHRLTPLTLHEISQTTSCRQRYAHRANKVCSAKKLSHVISTRIPKCFKRSRLLDPFWIAVHSQHLPRVSEEGAWIQNSSCCDGFLVLELIASLDLSVERWLIPR